MKRILSILAATALATAVYAQDGILRLNPQEKVLPLLLSARADAGTPYSPSEVSPLTLLHFSDLHGSCENLERIVSFYEAYSPYIDDAIHTGDAVSCYLDDLNPWTRVKGAGKVINVIGNHDCWKGHKTWAETDVPYDATAPEAYDKFIAPYVKGWNVVQPDGVNRKSSEYFGACYFYKDYPQSRVRMIVLDCMHYDSVQDRWFSEILDDALDASLTVIVAEHYFAQTGLVSVDSGFSTQKSVPACQNPDLPQIECMPDAAFATMDRFIDKGGVFVCWLSGHDHEDYIGHIPQHERQLQILVDKAGEKDGYMHEDRTPGTVNQDSFNLVTVNPEKSLLIIQRIGCTVGPQMRSKRLFSYNYLTRTVMANE